jgi:hypothetical protein
MRIFDRLFRGPEMPKGLLAYDAPSGMWEGREVANDGRLVWRSESMLEILKFMEDAGFDMDWEVHDAPTQP